MQRTKCPTLLANAKKEKSGIVEGKKQQRRALRRNSSMKKIPTLFIRDPRNMKFVTRDVHSDAVWVFEGHGVPTVKKDGTNVRITVKNEQCVLVEKRRNPTREEKALGAEPDYMDAHREEPGDKHIFAAVDATNFHNWPDGAWPCEALGPKIQGGVESPIPVLYQFTLAPLVIVEPIELTFDDIRYYLAIHPIEGIVWRDQRSNIDNPNFAKIKRRDFGFTWPVKKSRILG